MLCANTGTGVQTTELTECVASVMTMAVVTVRRSLLTCRVVDMPVSVWA